MSYKRVGYVVMVALLLILTTAVSLPAKEPGRYQAMEIERRTRGEYNIFILDTKDGHMWILETEESSVDGKLSGGLKYQGRLRPGKKAGEIIFEFGKK
ncbi:MAG: hypothetical protein JSU72_03180 [Deltaproteobacteria bacterium]|nr:MAG: hypothetical protein JSU72_03180 [Deltaproteobacteria bacterium]